MHSALISYMLLIDTMQATHCGLAANFSTSELFIRMPGSNHQFPTLYRSLLRGDEIPQDVRSKEDALLLLTALLNDIVYAQRCLPPTTVVGSGRQTHIGSKLRSPFTPLSAASEMSRLKDIITAGLSRWEGFFRPHVGNDILALFCFCKLQLICPDTWKLPQMAGYGETDSNSQHPGHPDPGPFQVPDKAMALAWLVLDHCHKISPKGKLSVWLPPIVFLSALVVWQRLRGESPANPKYGSVKVLSLFNNEIAGLSWPCTVEMMKTLNRLMET